MLVVKVELWPHGSEEQAVVIGRMEVSNDATGTGETGNYGVHLWAKNTGFTRVQGYKRSNCVWNLVLQALQTFDMKNVEQYHDVNKEIETGWAKVKEDFVKFLYG